MAIKHKEVQSSREGVDADDRSSVTDLVYDLYGSDVIDDMRAYIDAQGLAPDTTDGLIKRSYSREQREKELWRWTIHYVEADRSDKNDKLDVDESLFSFDTTGGTHKLTYSRSTQSFPRPGVTARDFKSAVNVQRDLSVQGTDIVVPALKFSLKVRKARAAITLAYVKTLARLTGCYNNATFKTFSAGELLFFGGVGQQGTNSDPEITFHFVASENVTGLTIGQITGISKRGHEYLWVWFDPELDAAANAIAPRPHTAYVEEVAKPGDFSLLGI
jgi:hypothetical protein